jgi:catechol 2,3-dioxygenase-like lactoylglutathione lyase family enzyme
MITDEAPHWRGINHLALITPDMDATVRFYHGVLGARLVAHLGNAAFRHYFFDFGPEQTVAFFEYKDKPVDAFAVAAGVPDARKIQFDHLSFNVADEHALNELQRRLKEHGCEVTDVVDHGFVRSIYFHDPHGIALEASWWVVDATGRAADYTDPGLFSDPDPVAAVRELVESGTLASTPATHLVNDDITDPA